MRRSRRSTRCCRRPDVAFQLADSGAAAVVTWGRAAQVIDGVRAQTALRLVIGVDTESGTPFEEFLDGHPADAAGRRDRRRTRPRAHRLHRRPPAGPRASSCRTANVVVNALQYACWSNGAVFDTEVRIVSPDGTGALPAGEPGEVCIRGPQVMRGYRHASRRPPTSSPTTAGCETGDIGVLDADGYLSIVDRTKDMLLHKGYNVYPREIEELLVAHPDVAAAAVVGRPDEAVGELPVAFVVPSGEGVDGDTLMRDVNERLAPYKQLRELQLTGEIPVSAAGKVLKRELRERL